jgi:hypothetical protein
MGLLLEAPRDAQIEAGMRYCLEQRERQGKSKDKIIVEYALRESSRLIDMTVAMVETGGDPGHAPARHTYEKQGFRLFPVARYFKKL